ncbi:hypothetical protein [Mycolicibacterium septicum]|uniref:hypothetical protein n=1 Tax=Mycolicibacterium septicum TaxID=98668 RepID=UPI001AF72166|nr:hypothetical protein [Mycolicibacterium septicum]QRY51703.1 hypothetical protein JVX95_30730 [Mycolicibacterium septicum]
MNEPYRVLDVFVDIVDESIGLEDHWKVVELGERDFDRTCYGREFELKKTNESGAQGWVAGRFTRDGLIGLRDLLTRVLDETEQ